MNNDLKVKILKVMDVCYKNRAQDIETYRRNVFKELGFEYSVNIKKIVPEQPNRTEQVQPSKVGQAQPPIRPVQQPLDMFGRPIPANMLKQQRPRDYSVDPFTAHSQSFDIFGAPSR